MKTPKNHDPRDLMLAFAFGTTGTLLAAWFGGVDYSRHEPTTGGAVGIALCVGVLCALSLKEFRRGD